MPRDNSGKIERQKLLSRYLAGNPFLTDEDLAQILKVSIQTVRLDRTELHIPELRERIKNVARGVYGQVKALQRDDWVGELVDLELGRQGISVLTVSEEMTSKNSSVARGHYIFAQANCLAVALIDSRVALTGTAKVSFKRPVYRGERIVARAYISRKKGNKYIVRVTSKVGEETIFQGKFLVFAIA
ncbi:MAG: transcription factor FapR [Desulfotomaculales bacterium]